ncbi:MAG: hypothetical protein V2A78_04595 [bacterium]
MLLFCFGAGFLLCFNSAKGSEKHVLLWGELLQGGKGKLLLSSGELIQTTEQTRILRNGLPSSPDCLAIGDRLFVTLPEEGGAALSIESLDCALFGKQVSPPSPGAIIWKLQHSARRPLRREEVLNITMKGSAGGAASCRLVGTGDKIALKEKSPGLYQGSWKVRDDCDLGRGALIGSLKKGTHSATPFISNELSLAPSPPLIEQRSPAPGSTVFLRRPSLFVVCTSSAGVLDPSGFRLWLNGRDLSFRAARSGNLLFYSPDEDVPSGKNEVRVRVRDRAGNVVENKWSFEIQ